jgi:Undecaprenyl-phosphate glucose phosphotransferase
LVKQRHQIFVALLALMDGLVVASASLVAWIIRELVVERPKWPERWEGYAKEPLFLFAIPVLLYAMWFFGLYRPRRDRSIWSEQVQLAKAIVLGMGGLVVVLWAVGNNAVTGYDSPEGAAMVFGHPFYFGRFQLTVLGMIVAPALCVHRYLFRAGLRGLRRRGWNLRHAAVVGVGRLGQITCRTINRNSWTGINVACFISHHDHTRRTTCQGRPVLGGLADLERILEETQVDAVYLAIPSSAAAGLPKLLQRLERFAVDVRVIPDVNPRHLPHSMVVSELDGMPILSYRESPLYGMGGVTKRALDLLGSALAIILFSPLLLLVGLLVRFSGPGPLIFKQRRVSLGGEEFNIFKFRTMYHVEDEKRAGGGGGTAAGEAATWTQRNDPRVTPIGRWLRKASLDELPQLFNVLVGEMSLVGPRPERPELIERFRDDWRGYMLRQHVKAGMTGWAQVNGLRGQTSLRKRLQYDLFYIRHWSLWFDLRILWLTVFKGFVHRNAH